MSGERLTVNSKFAAEYADRKTREAFTGQDERRSRQGGGAEGGSGEDDESSSASDEDDAAELLTGRLQKDILSTLQKIRNKDPSIYQKDATFYPDRGGGGSSGSSSDSSDGSSSDDDDDDDDDDDTDAKAELARQRAKPLRYKDIVRENAMRKSAALDAGADASESDSTSDEEQEDDGGVAAGKRAAAAQPGYFEEQEANKASFLDKSATSKGAKAKAKAKGKAAAAAAAAGGAGSDSDSDSDSDGDAFFTVRSKTKEEEAAELLAQDALVSARKSKRSNDLLDLGGGNSLASEKVGDDVDAEEFLNRYLTERRWEEPEDEVPRYEQVLAAGPGGGNDSEDGEAVDEAEAFETKYNFRFEAPGGTEIQTHARTVEGSLRRDDKAERRKREREAKKARKAEMLRQKREELKRLKNLKLEEIRKKLAAVERIGGKAWSAARVEELDQDFDPAAHDRMMGSMYDDGYYAEEGGDGGGGGGGGGASGGASGSGSGGFDGEEEDMEGDVPVKPTFDDDDDDDDEPVEWEGGEDGAEGGGEEEWGEGGGGAAAGAEEEEEEQEPLTEEQQEDLERAQADVRRDVAALHAMDYEDVIAGGLKTRYKYHKVEKQAYGLTAEDILNADDRDLTQLVPLKKLAPYRDTPWVVPVWKQQKWKKQMRAQWKEQSEQAAREAAKEKEEAKAAKAAEKAEKYGAKAEAAAPEAAPEAGADAAGGKKKRKKKGKKRKAEEEGEFPNPNAGNVPKKPTHTKKAKMSKTEKAAQKHGISASRAAAYGL